MAIVEARRRLAVILAADIVGYSRLMALDEDGTVQTLATYQEVIASLVAEHHGRIFNLAGDGILAEFASAVQAVRCAVAIQRMAARRNGDLAADRQVMFRIGLNLGDVVARGDDLLGDGVNVAARLQALAEPEQICIAAAVREQIEGKVDVRLRVARRARPQEPARGRSTSTRSTGRCRRRCRWRSCARAPCRCRTGPRLPCCRSPT